MKQGWRERNRPPRLERRYQFENYDQLRDFLDKAAELSEQEALYPDMGFGTDYLNVTIHAEEGNEALTEKQRAFAETLDGIGGYSENG
jgi:pterin-4a-carbinolamine dehydratase